MVLAIMAAACWTAALILAALLGLLIGAERDTDDVTARGWRTIVFLVALGEVLWLLS